MRNQKHPITPKYNGDNYYNDLLNQENNPDRSVHDDDVDENKIVISDDGQEKSGCMNKIKRIVKNEKFIIVIAKMSVVLTGMVGPLYLFIQESDLQENMSYFGYQQINRNDYPFQKVFFKYLCVVGFFYYKQYQEQQPKNSRDFISGQESKQFTTFQHAVYGLVDFLSFLCFVFSLGYTSILRAYLFGGTQFIIFFLNKKKESTQIYTSEKIAFCMALCAQLAILFLRIDELQKEESFYLGDLTAFFGGILSSLNFWNIDFKQKDYYSSLYMNNVFSLGFSFIVVLIYDTSGFLIDLSDLQNILLLIAIAAIQCITSVKKIKTFVFMSYFKNIFEPIVGFKFEYLFGLIFLDTWTILIIFLVLYVPANIIMLSKHIEDIKNNNRHRDSTFVDVLAFEEYIEMKEVDSPDKLTRNKTPQKS